MRIFSVIVLGFILISSASAQEIDSLKIMQLELDEIAVTATQTKRKKVEIPAQIDVITASEIENYPLNNIDDLLRGSANVNVNRSWGIFSKNSSVTMRGLEGSDRTLVLVNGVPKNKLGGGSVNWHNVNPSTIERIEIIKGPASSLYGNNAMGGVINIITKTPTEKLDGLAEAFIGSYGTKGSSLNLSGRKGEADKGLYWKLNGYFRKGDGYIFEPPEYLDETDVPTYLKEYGGGGLLGYQISKDHSLEVGIDYYDEMRGAGRKVFMEDGSFTSYQTYQLKTKYTGKIAGGDLSAVLYYNLEDYFAQKESINDYLEYRLLDSYSDKGDCGFRSVYSKELVEGNTLTVGIEGKSGSLDGEELYRTSPDIIRFKGGMSIVGLFVQDEINLIEDKLKIIAGLRGDYVNFGGGYQEVITPSKVTGFKEGFKEDYNPNSWVALSPKLALQYSFNPRARIYLSYGQGFMPPGLKDLSQTGKITKGFRLANPDLTPEYLTNYEVGFNGLIGEKVSVSTAIYHSRGRDFLYMLATGDSIDTGGSSLKPVILPSNIARIGVLGGEMSMVYYLNKNLKINAGYSYNHSIIIEYPDDKSDPERNLTGNYINEVSPHLFYTNINFRNRFFRMNLNSSYVSEQWYDDQNTIKIDDYFLLNFRLSKDIRNKIRIYLDIQNILDNEYVDRKGQLNPGRYITTGLKYTFSGK